jgi:hypothetical protein
MSEKFAEKELTASSWYKVDALLIDGEVYYRLVREDDSVEGPRPLLKFTNWRGPG